MANLRDIDNEHVFIQLPASNVYLLDENYHMPKALPNIEDRQKIDRAFVIFSVIKRAIGMAKRREKWWQQRELCVATSENKELLDFITANSVFLLLHSICLQLK